MRCGHRPSRAATAFPQQCPTKWYERAFYARGIHGQWPYIDPRPEMVAAKFSSQPVAVCDDGKRLNLAFFAAIAKMV